MAPMQERIRRAFNLLKDHTSISVARVSNAGMPDLGIAILKATSHEEVPSDERYVQAILRFTSLSRLHVNACVFYIARRLSKTHNWVVAMKALILAHRLLRDGDPAFEKELIVSQRQGMPALNVSEFRDESHPNGWDFSTFVHAYGHYLNARLDCSAIGLHGGRPFSNRTAAVPCNNSEMKHIEKEQSMPFRDMKPIELMDVLPSFQCLLGCVLACKPIGRANMNRLVSVALYAVIRESFVLYADLQDGLKILHSAFFNMELNNCARVLDMFNRAAKQMEGLISFYSFCQSLGICKTAHYPNVQVFSKGILLEMEEFITNGGRRNQERRSPEPLPWSPPKEKGECNSGSGATWAHAEEFTALTFDRGIKNITTDSNSTPNSLPVNILKTSLSEELGDKFALALVSESQTNAECKWEAFPEHPMEVSTLTTSKGGVNSWELALIDSESEFVKQDSNSFSTSTGAVTGWELALVESGSEVGKLTSSASIVTFSDGTQSNALILPPPRSSTSSMYTDLVSASEGVPPCPTYVHMSEMQQARQLLVQEQQQWLQSQHDGKQSNVGLTNCSNNPFVSSFQTAVYPVTYHTTNPYYS